MRRRAYARRVRYWIDDDDNQLTAPLGAREEQLLREVALPNLKPVSIDDYRAGFSVMRETAARTSAIIDGGTVLVCVEWEPGVIVLQVGDGFPIAAIALRDPRPDFGGREPLADDLPFDDDEMLNPLYDLIFTPWDAQLDPTRQADAGFIHATAAEQNTQQRAFRRLASLPEPAPITRSTRIQCLADWTGIGTRIPSRFLQPPE